MLSRTSVNKIIPSSLQHNYSETTIVSMLRGKNALGVEDCGDHLTITAKLADGAQLRRCDDIVFNRTIILCRGMIRYRIAVKFVDHSNAKDFPTYARSAKLNLETDGMS